jgi:hypothetical protein
MLPSGENERLTTEIGNLNNSFIWLKIKVIIWFFLLFK